MEEKLWKIGDNSLRTMLDEEGPEKVTRGAMNPELLEYVGRPD